MRGWRGRKSLQATLLVAGVVSIENGMYEHASVEQPRLEQIVSDASMIVLAKVTEVEGLPEGGWKAVGHVLETWKGSPRDSVVYGPSHCSGVSGETSSARVGETVVLFLVDDRVRIGLRIAAAGSGRLPVYTIDGKQVVESHVGLPAGASITQGLVDGVERGLVPLEWLRARVKALSSADGNGK